METYLTHEDTRVRAILALAQHSAEYPAFDDAPLEAAVVAILPNVPPRDAVNAFRLVAEDLASAVDFETNGAEAVRDRFGSWKGTYLSADEKATELAEQCRLNAWVNAELVVSRQDAMVTQ